MSGLFPLFTFEAANETHIRIIRSSVFHVSFPLAASLDKYREMQSLNAFVTKNKFLSESEGIAEGFFKGFLCRSCSRDFNAIA